MDLLRMLVQVALVAAMAAPTTSAQANPPNCQDRCGSIIIPYPFGTRPGCYYDESFLVTCEKAFTPKLFLAKDGIEITKISPNGELGILQSIARDCYNQSGQRTILTIPPITFSKFQISSTKNKFTAIGCDTRASIIGEKDGKNYSSGCMTTCDSPNYVTNGFCPGIGCCQTNIPNFPKGVDNYTMDLDSHFKPRNVWNFSPCSYAFVVEEEKFNFSSTYLTVLEKVEIKLPVVLDWAIGDKNCNVASKSPGYACKDNSNCSEVSFGPGYRCYCSEGYIGNPYVANGCQDIDECKDPNLNQCEKNCENTPGNYTCSCPKGYHGDGRKDGKGCIVDQQREIKTGVGIGMGVLVLIVGCSSFYWVINERMVSQQKNFFFEQNGGSMLEKMLQSTEATNERNYGSVEPTNERNDGSVEPTNERNYGSVERNDGSVEPSNERNDESVEPSNERNDGSVERNDGSVEPSNERNDGSVEATNERNDESVEPSNERNDGSVEPNNERNNKRKDGSVEAKIFTIEELMEATNNFDKERIVGQGGFGVVYEGVLPEDKKVAIKKCLKVFPKVGPTQVHQFIRNVFELFGIDQLLSGCLEVEVPPKVHPSQEQFIGNMPKLFRTNHKNVVKLLGCCLEVEAPCLVYEFIPNGSLYRHIQEDSVFAWKTRLSIAKETAVALSYLHSISIIHRDVKSTNILLEDDFTAKVSEVGTSRIGQLNKIQLPTMVQGTLGYLDPEYFSTNQLSDKSDVYSFGVVLVELLTGRMAFSDDDGPKEERLLSTYFINSIKKNRSFLDPRIENEKGITEQVRKVANLAQCCLRLEGDKRPTMREVKIKLEQIMRDGKPLRTSLDDEKSKKTDHLSGKLVDYGGTSTSITDFIAGDDIV